MDVPSYLLGKNAGGGPITETDPVFSASAAAGITAADINKWNNAGGTTSDITMYQSSLTLALFQYQLSNDIKTGIISVLNEAYSDGAKKIMIALNEQSNICLYANSFDISTKPTGEYDFWGFFMSGTPGYSINEFDDGNIPTLYSLFLRISNITWSGDTITDLTIGYVHTSYSNLATKNYVDTAITSALGGSY